MEKVRKFPNIEFNSIRQHHGNCHCGFEEMVVSLFRHEHGEPFDIIRVDGAGGDGGVEAYIHLPNGTITGLQTKFFEKLGVKQFIQIEKSLETARKNHPTLTTYIVAVRQNLNPTQIKKCNLAKENAESQKPPIKLVWWGESELMELLTRPEHMGRLVYWFGASLFDDLWLKAHNQRARDDLDTRYTPAKHVRVEIQYQLDAFAQSPGFIAEYYEKARRVWIMWRASLEIYEPEKISKEFSDAVVKAQKIGESELPRLGDGEKLPSWTAAAEALDLMLGENVAMVRELERLSTPPSHQQIGKEAGNAPKQDRPNFGYRMHELNKTYRQLRSLAEFIEEHTCTMKRLLLLRGEAGAGKSHLLAKFVDELEERGQVVLFVLGEYFTSGGEPWNQLTSRIGWTDSADDLLAALNYAAEVSAKPALLIIDALNESHERRVWQNHLAGFADRLLKWPWVRLLVACRSDFAPHTIPQRIWEGREENWAQIFHRGFGASTFDAVASYFESYGVKARDYPPLLPEFENPLFLKTFAEAFAGSEIPTGPLSLDLVMTQRIRVTCLHIRKAIDCPSDSTNGALLWLAEELEKNGFKSIPRIDARRRIDSFFNSTGESRSLYHHLKSNGLITEVGSHDYRVEPEERVRFAYERFSDYFIAKRMLRGITSAGDFQTKWKAQGYEAWNGEKGYFSNRGIMRALAILLPEQLGLELIDVVSSPEVRRAAIGDFLLSLPWRTAASINPRSLIILRESQEVVPTTEVITMLLRVSSIPGHPWNAHYLHSRLKPLQLADRDLGWTIPVTKMLGDGDSVPEILVQWLYRLETTSISDDQARLIGTVLTWFFSSNDRGLRQRATYAAIKLLLGKAEVAAILVRDFHNVNDPYIIERVYAVAAGVAAREHKATKLLPLATAVWETMCAPSIVKPHIHARHYAHMVMERASLHEALPKGVEPKDFKPPYRSIWPQIWKEEDARVLDSDDGWAGIIHSIEPEYGKGMGGYGDFGRYVMQSHVHQWSNAKVSEPYPEDQEGREFDEHLARRWVLQRIVELGWTPEWFSDYECQLSRRREREDIEERKQERIGKKYQWIALRELEAYLSDHFHLSRRWRAEPVIFDGAWQLFGADFDPTKPLEDPAIEYVGKDVDEDEVGPIAKRVDAWINYPSPFRDKILTRNGSAWVRQIPDDPGQLLRVPCAPGLASDAIILGLWQSWDQPDSFPPRLPSDGVPHLYIHARAWIILKKHRPKWLKFLRETHFWGDGVSLPELRASDLGEYPRSKRFEDFRKRCENQDSFGRDFPPGLGHAACFYGNSSSLPSPRMVDILGAKWSGKNFDFVDTAGDVVSTSIGSGLSSCLVRQDKLLAALQKHEMTLLWGLLGERHCFSSNLHRHVADSSVTFSGAYYLAESGEIKGGLTMRHIVDIPEQGNAYKGNFPETMELLAYGTRLSR